MKKIIFSQASIFHLYRLGLLVGGKTGVRYRLVNQEEMNRLIRYCDRTSDQTVRRQYEAFLASAEPNVLAALEEQKLIQPGRVLRQNTA